MRVFILFLLLGPVCASAQFIEMGVTTGLSQPVSTMARSMDNAFALSLEAARKFKTPFSLGLEMNFGNYGYQSTRQEYTFDDGSVTETDVNVANNLFTLAITGKHFLREGKKINPYLSGKAGLTWFSTSLRIEDPADIYDCHPIESTILSRDHTYLVSGGAGLRIDFVTIMPEAEPDHILLDVSIHATRGGIVRYMNVDKDHPGVPDRDVMAKFLNTQNQVIHEHHVGSVYSSMLSMMEYKIGVIYKPQLW